MNIRSSSYLLGRLLLFYLCCELIDAQSFSGIINRGVLTMWGYNTSQYAIFRENCNITGIEAGTFQTFNTLEVLDLTRNRLTTISVTTFYGLFKLRLLFLDYNEITTIDSNAFQSLPNIFAITLQHNKIKSIEANTFANLNSLYRLQLFDNSITTIDPTAFRALDNLEELELNRNEITVIDPAIFQDMYKLRFLSLHSNRILSIDPRTFQNLRNLTGLKLGHNKFTSLDRRTFLNLNKLKSLSLAGVDALYQPYLFQYLTGLNELDISENLALKIIEAGLFSGLNSLTTLVLKWCNIDTVDPSAFMRLHELRSIDLSYNMISYIHQDSFKNFKSLSLNLYGNMIPLNTKFNGNVSVIY